MANTAAQDYEALYAMKFTKESSYENTVDVSFPNLSATKKTKIVNLLKDGKKIMVLIQEILDSEDEEDLPAEELKVAKVSKSKV